MMIVGFEPEAHQPSAKMIVGIKPLDFARENEYIENPGGMNG